MSERTITTSQLREIYEQADKRMKQTNGHAFLTVLKTRCRFCGRSPNQKGTCSAWFRTYLEHLEILLIANNFVVVEGSKRD